MSFDDPNIQVGPSFNINSLQGYLDWEVAGSLARRHSDGCDGIFACSQALARKANAEGRLVTIFDVGEFKYIDDVEALALLGPLALTSLAGIRKKHLPLLHRINIDGARVRFVSRVRLR